MNKPVILFAKKDKSLASQVADLAGFSSLQWETEHFANSETIVRIPQSIRNQKAYVFFSTIAPTNESFFELFIAIDAIKRCAVSSVVLVAPFLAYGRQERKMSSREPVSTALIAQLLESAGVDKIITIDPHAPSSIGFYRVPFESASFQKNLLIHFFQKKIDNFVLAFPDFNAQKKAQKWNQLLKKETVVFSKMRTGTNKIEMKLLYGDPQNKNVVMVDDMIDTGSTICRAISFLRSLGAKKVFVLATHGIFSGSALTKMAELHQKGELAQVLISDSYPSELAKKHSFVEVISMASLLAKLVDSDHHGKSLATHFAQLDQELIKKANEK